MKTHPNSVWNASASVRSTYTQDGGVLLDVEKGMCYSLNAVASKLWNHLEKNQNGVSFETQASVRFLKPSLARVFTTLLTTLSPSRKAW